VVEEPRSGARPALTERQLQMSNLVRSAADSPISEFFRRLDLNRPSRLSDVTHYIPVESYADGDVEDVTATYQVHRTEARS
jgi:hypothetical protein